MKRILAIFFILVSLLFGVTTSHAALYFPHVDTTVNQWQTEICVINSSATATVQGNMESYSNDGNLVATMPLSVGPNARRQIDVGTELTNAGTTGYIVFQNTSGSPVGYTKFTQSGGDRVAIPAVDGASTGNLYITHIAWAPWWTGISLVNTTSETKTLTIRFNTGRTKSITLGPKQHRAYIIAQLLDNLIDTRIISAVIENAGGIVGLELFGNGSQLGGVPLISKTATTLFYPHVESAGGWSTGIVAYNPSTTTSAQITVNPYDTNSNLLGSSTRSIGPGDKLIGYSIDLNLPAATAWFSLQSQNPLVGFELFGNSIDNNLAGYSVVDLERKSGIFPKVEKNGGWTGIAFVNTEDQQATVNLTAYNDPGNEVATGTKTLTAKKKWVGYAADLFPGINLNTATYLSFSADRKVAGFQLNGSGSMLDALPALPGSPPGDEPMEVINKVLALFKYQSTVTLAMQTVTDIMGQILNSESGSTCPQVSVNPPLTNLEELPPAITLTASYGNGCTATDGSTISGQVVLAITNLALTETSVGLGFALTATNLTRNGVLMLNGSVSGNIALNVNESVISQANVSVHFNNFHVADSSLSGNLTMTATNLNVSSYTADNITISFDHLTAGGYTVNSGTLQVTSTGSNTIQMVANLNTEQGNVSVTLMVQSPSNTRTIISTPSPGTFGNCTVTLTNVTLDTTVCNGYPSDGSITVSKDGSSATVTFTPTCPAGQMRDRVFLMQDLNPSQDRNPWINFSTSLYKYLKIKKTEMDK
jgi:hypothetical protein